MKSAIPKDNWSARWVRSAQFTAGWYRFRTFTDDGVRLWVDGKLVIDQWFDMPGAANTADVYLTAGAPDKASAQADLILQKQPGNDDALALRAAVLLVTGHIPESRAILEGLMRKGLTKPELYIMLSNIHLMQKENGKAHEVLRRAEARREDGAQEDDPRPEQRPGDREPREEETVGEPKGQRTRRPVDGVGPARHRDDGQESPGKQGRRPPARGAWTGCLRRDRAAPCIARPSSCCPACSAMRASGATRRRRSLRSRAPSS